MKKLLLCILCGLLLLTNLGFCAKDDVKNPCVILDDINQS